MWHVGIFVYFGWEVRRAHGGWGRGTSDKAHTWAGGHITWRGGGAHQAGWGVHQTGKGGITHGAHITQNEWEEQGGPLFFEVHMFMVC